MVDLREHARPMVSRWMVRRPFSLFARTLNEPRTSGSIMLSPKRKVLNRIGAGRCFA